jgi:hypothetical protein
MEQAGIMPGQRWMIAAALAATVALGLASAPAQGQVRVDPQPLPYYARIVTGTSEWSPVIFYRPADCIPQTVNLLAFSDPPRAFACSPMTVDGFAIWETGPGLDPAPRQARLQGLGEVPIWFVRTGDYLQATADSALTISELEALAPLTGHALRFTQTQHPFPPVENSLLVVNATGALDDGRSFRLHITYQSTKDHRLVDIDFGD